MSKRHQFEFHGFHGGFVASVMVPSDALVGGYAPISKRVARRLSHLACGSPACTCGESPAIEQEDGSFVLPLSPVLRGRYS